MTEPHFGSHPTSLTITPTDPRDADAQTRQTLTHMAEIIRKEAAAPIVHTASEHAGILTGSRIEGAQREWQFVRGTVEFQGDEAILSRVLGISDALDLLIEPSRLLTMPRPAGDCDDQVMLAGAMLTHAGVPVELVVTKSDEDDPTRWSHVFLQVVLENGQRYVLDCSHGPYPGWEVPRQYDRLVYNLQGKEIHPPMPINMNRGLGGDDFGGESGYDWSYDVPSQSEIYYGGGGAPQNMPSNNSGWDTVLQGLVKTSGSIAQQYIAPLQKGEYVQQLADGSYVRSNAVAGAVPFPGTSLSVATGNISPTMILLGVAALVAVVVMSGKH